MKIKRLITDAHRSRILEVCWTIQVAVVVGEPLSDLETPSCVLPKKTYSDDIRKRELISSGSTAVGPPGRAESDCQAMLDIFQTSSGPQDHLIKTKWLIADTTSVGSPARTESVFLSYFECFLDKLRTLLCPGRNFVVRNSNLEPKTLNRIIY